MKEIFFIIEEDQDREPTSIEQSYFFVTLHHLNFGHNGGLIDNE